jgi:pyruvate,orthophosphate dikinase
LSNGSVSTDDDSHEGNKGADLAEMTRLGLPVPPGFIISTEACNEYFEDESNRMPQSLIDEYGHELEVIF